MEEYMIYVDGNGFRYVKGDVGGGYTLNWDGGYDSIDKLKLWDYCNDVTEEQISRFCKKTEDRFELNL